MPIRRKSKYTKQRERERRLNPPQPAEEEIVSDTESDLSESDKELQLAFARNEIDTEKLNFWVPFVPREIINNVEGLKESLEKFTLNLPWIERMDLVNDLAPVAPELEDHLNNDDDDAGEDDFKREVIFYRQAQAAVLEGIPKLKKLGVPTKRPEDYFAQMVKTDEHMQKVRQVLVNKQAAMERRDKVRKMRELRKYGKQVQTEVLQQRAKEKRQMIDSVKKFRKWRKDKADFECDDDGSAGKKGAKDVKGKPGLQNKHAKLGKGKRAAKDLKYGFGGKKKRSKYNDATSVAEFDFPGSRSKNSKFGGKNKKVFSNKKKGTKNYRKGRK